MHAHRIATLLSSPPGEMLSLLAATVVLVAAHLWLLTVLVRCRRGQPAREDARSPAPHEMATLLLPVWVFAAVTVLCGG